MMPAYGADRRLVESLRTPPEHRSLQDLATLYSYMKGVDGLSHLRESTLRSLSQVARYEFHHGEQVLYSKGDPATEWYILLSGSVFIQGTMYLSRNSFGKPEPGLSGRPNDCLILEQSEMMVIPASASLAAGADHTGVSPSAAHQQSGIMSDQPPPGAPHHLPLVSVAASQGVAVPPGGALAPYAPRRSSRMSDTSSSMYSGSADDPELENGNCDSLIDSDEDEDTYSEATAVRDAGRECLEKDPQERTEDDIETLLEFMQNFQAFANMTMAIRRALCAVMVFAVVESANTVVMNDKEELDSWSIILNGSVQITQASGETKSLTMGDSFGITHPTLEKLSHKGVMKTITEDCQFVCIAQKDYYDILSQGKENIVNVEEEGKVVLVSEKRSKEGGEGAVVIRGTPKRLIRHLVANHSLMEVTYVEDFLLMYRAFLQSPMEVADQLLEWFQDETLRDKVTRVVLLWVNNHFNDFEAHVGMSDFLQRFEDMLEEKHLFAPLKLLHIACHAKARPRTVTITRSTRDESLHFAVIGGRERSSGIFILSVDRGSKAYEGGLKRGDQILEVNGNNLEKVTYDRAMEVLRGPTLLHISVKSNFLHFRDMQSSSAGPRPNLPFAMQNPEISMYKIKVKDVGGGDASDSVDGAAGAGVGVDGPVHKPIINASQAGNVGGRKKSTAAQTNTLNNKFKRALEKMKILPSNKPAAQSMDVVDVPRPRANSTSTTPSPLQRSNSSPDIPSATYGVVEAEGHCEFPEQVLKIYKADQTSKYFFVHKDTTAGATVITALRQFGISEHSSHLQSSVTCNNYSLCEVSVDQGGLVKQKRLPDNAMNLMERMAVNARYYLKNNMSQEPLVGEEAVQDLMKETHYTLLNLSPAVMAIELSLADHTDFRDVQATEYVDDLHAIQSHYGHKGLDRFANLVNKEMFWVVTEICSEHNIVRRMRVMKHFIKIARYCKDTKNFNSMFAIISGLGHGAVTRLRDTWNKLPSKYHKVFEDLQGLMNPTRNMAKYRNLLATASQQPPVIPFFPIIKKDLTFIHLGNDTRVEGLINFEKMRMIAKEVRHICNVASAVYKPADLIPSTQGGAGSVFSGFTGGSGSAANSGVYTIRKKKRSSTIMQPKRLYEENMMARRVRAFLASPHIEHNEDRLSEMSYQCEPNRRGEVQSSASFMSDRSSSSLSLAPGGSASSASVSMGPKFGVDSPEGVRKLMALSEKSKTVSGHHNIKRGMTSPLLQQRNNNNSSSLQSTAASAGLGALRGGAALRPVNLSAESSSVGGGGMQRKASNASAQSGTRTPSDPSAAAAKKFVFPGGGIGPVDTANDRDSGHCSLVSCEETPASSVNSNSPPMSVKATSAQTHAHHAVPASLSRPPPPAYHAAVQKSQVYAAAAGSSSANPYTRGAQQQFMGSSGGGGQSLPPQYHRPLHGQAASGPMLSPGQQPRKHPSIADCDQDEVVSAV